MGSFRVDTSQWPLVVHSVDGTLDDAQIDAYADAGTAVLMRKERHAVIFDLRSIGRTSAYARRRNQQWQQQYRAELEQWCSGIAYVIPSPLIRYITMTVLLVGRPPTPYRVCSTMDEATAWVRERLQ